MLYPWWGVAANLTRHFWIARLYNLVAFGHKELWRPLATIHIGSTKSARSLTDLEHVFEHLNNSLCMCAFSRMGATGNVLLDSDHHAGTQQQPYILLAIIGK